VNGEFRVVVLNILPSETSPSSVGMYGTQCTLLISLGEEKLVVRTSVNNGITYTVFYCI